MSVRMNIQASTLRTLFLQRFNKLIGVIIFIVPVLVAVVFMQSNSRTELIRAKERLRVNEKQARETAVNAALYQRYKVDFDSLIQSQDTAAGNRLRWQQSIDDSLLKFSDRRQDALKGADSSIHFTLERRMRWNTSEANYDDEKSTSFPSVYATQAEFKVTLSNENKGFQLLYDLLISNQILAHIESCGLQLITFSSTTSSVSLACNAQIFDFEWPVSVSSESRAAAGVKQAHQPQINKVFLQPNRRLLDRQILKSEPVLSQTVLNPPIKPVVSSATRKTKNEQSQNTMMILNQTYHRTELHGSVSTLNDGQRPNYFLGQRVTRIWNNQTRKEGVQ